MNCKPGDLAVLVRSCAGNEGAIVECRRFLGYVGNGWVGEDYWEIDRSLPGKFLNSGMPSEPAPLARDSAMRPIRDNPGNEQFVVEARNKLKGKTEINERGEVSV